MEFENKVYENIYYSRFVASWIKSGGTINYCARKLNQSCDFIEWLRSLIINGKNIPEEVVWDIYCYATCGKMELEDSAKKWLNKN